MGLGGCYTFLKYLLVILNLIFWILGIVGVVFGVWMLVDPTFSFSLTQDYVISVIIILIASILLVIVAAFGVVGALKENQCALTTFFCLLLIIFVAEISAGVWAYVNSEDLTLQVKNAVKLTVEQEYAVNDNRRELFDTFQKKLECCGADAATDWMSKQVVMTVQSQAQTYDIPRSCCREGKSEEECSRATQKIKTTGGVDYTVVYRKGCYESIISQLKEHSCLLLTVGIAVVVVQFLGLIFALVLAFAVNRSNRYKA